MSDPAKNFAKVIVSGTYSSADTAITLQAGEGAKLPAPASDGAFNLVWWNYTDYPDPSGDPNKEIVRCTARTVDALTVTRNQESSGASTKNTAGKTYMMALSFTKKMYDDILHGEVYVADTAANDTYLVAPVPAYTAYVTGMRINFKAVTANTGAATLNVNGIGAISIVKNVSTALDTGDILANQIVSVLYDGTNFVIISSRSGLVEVANNQTITGDKTLSGATLVTGNLIGKLFAPQGFLINGKISPSVASNDLTVAIKTLAGTDPSASDPVYCRIGDTVRAITSALSVTKNDGTNWFNAGSAELATKEIDYFVYLGYNATDGVVIGFSRYPGANSYNDFSVTSTNEKYCAISTITTAASTDYYEVVGRFAATLSAGAGYTWTVPTFTARNLVQKPIYMTRALSYTPTFTYTAGVAPTTPGNENNVYWLDYKTAYVRVSKIYSGNGTTVTRCDISLPIGSNADQSPIGGAVFSNSFAPIATMNQFHASTTQMFCASSTVNRVGFFVSYELA